MEIDTCSILGEANKEAHDKRAGSVDARDEESQAHTAEFVRDGTEPLVPYSLLTILHSHGGFLVLVQNLLVVQIFLGKYKLVHDEPLC